ncbi:MAG: HAD family hydrolase [Candidatus Hydrothermarchaeota archaeon]
MTEIKAILFDLYGTLLTWNEKDSFRVGNSICKLARELGYDVRYSEYEDARNTVYLEYSLGKLHDDKSAVKKIFSLLGHEVLENHVELLLQIYKKYYELVFPVINVENTLEDLRKKYKLAIITNAPLKWVLSDLNYTGLSHYFELIITSDMVKVRKPHRKIFEQAVSSLGVSPKECIFVGNDRKRDCKGAKKAGLNVLCYGIDFKDFAHLPHKIKELKIKKNLK